MNLVVLSGNITRDLEVKKASNDLSVLKFSIAINETKEKVIFINCVAFGKTAEFISLYFGKGDGIEIQGKIQTGSYEKEGQKVYTTDVIVEKVEFPKGSKKKENNEFKAVNMTDSDLPF